MDLMLRYGYGALASADNQYVWITEPDGTALCENCSLEVGGLGFKQLFSKGPPQAASVSQQYCGDWNTRRVVKAFGQLKDNVWLMVHNCLVCVREVCVGEREMEGGGD